MRMPLVTVLASLVLCGALVSCASRGPDRGSGGSGTLTAHEMEELSVVSLHDAIRRLRPQWLNTRGTLSVQNPDAGLPVVFLDEVRYGPPSFLHRIRIADVEMVAYLNARDATTRHGTGHAGGVIHVTTKK